MCEPIILFMHDKILAIHDGHTATAALIQDGKVLACVSEERLNRVKEWGGVPKLAMQEVLNITKTEPHEVGHVIVPSLINPVTSMKMGRRSAPRRLFGKATKIVPGSTFRGDWWIKPAVGVLSRFRHKDEIRKALKDVGISREPEFCEHHLAHAASAYYPNWNGVKEDTLVITADGSGDCVSATISIGHDYEMKRVLNISNYNSIGELYSRVTEFMGMKPLSHEYKVMGLAPYTKEKYARQTAGKFRRMIRISPKNPLLYENVGGAWKWDYLNKFKKELDGERFDNIAGGLQIFFEDLVLEWIGNIIRKYDIHNIALAGGIFMNVKANQKILELPEVEKFFVMPSCGDESLAIGAGLHKYVELCKVDGLGPKVEPLGPLYYGPEYGEADAEAAIKAAGLKGKYKVEKINDIDGYIGEELVKGVTIARVSGRSEWGARALGNRSILADARNHDVVRKINEAVKMRDFWMPFAPSILREREADFIVNKKNFYAPYMVVSFDSTEYGRKNLKAAMHQYDFTIRPQVVDKDWNPGYHHVLKSFEKASGGVGGFLNTSFNLHGDPVVCSPADAIYTFENSGLDQLAVGDWLISRT
jgi:carbamoyltransferase